MMDSLKFDSPFLETGFYRFQNEQSSLIEGE